LDGGDGFQTWKISFNILNKQLRADKGGIPAWVGEGENYMEA
jgi:hypothetical protein